MKALHRVFQFFFECHHSDLSRVFTIENRTYQVCFACGRELNYSWELMHSMKPSVPSKDRTPQRAVALSAVAVAADRTAAANVPAGSCSIWRRMEQEAEELNTFAALRFRLKSQPPSKFSQ
jgi:hypothetical protein